MVLFKTTLLNSFRALANNYGLTKLKYKFKNYSIYTIRYLGELNNKVNKFKEGIKERKIRFKEYKASIKEL